MEATSTTIRIVVNTPVVKITKTTQLLLGVTVSFCTLDSISFCLSYRRMALLFEQKTCISGLTTAAQTLVTANRFTVWNTKVS